MIDLLDISISYFYIYMHENEQRGNDYHYDDYDAYDD